MQALKETEFTCSAGIAHNKVQRFFISFLNIFSLIELFPSSFLRMFLLADVGQTSKWYEQARATNCRALLICERIARFLAYKEDVNCHLKKKKSLFSWIWFEMNITLGYQ